MAITYQAGRRIQGTSTDFGTAGAGIPAVAGGWKELARTTLGSAGDTISVASLPDKRYYMVLGDYIPTGGNVNGTHRYNNDSGSNYANRYSDNGGADGTGTSSTEVWCNPQEDDHHLFGVSYISNLAGKEKLVLFNGANANSTGASNAPARRETSGKWSNTSSAINRIDAINTDAGSFNTNSEVVVLGWDTDDTHTTNFWEELASVDLTGGAAATLSSGTITAKKYLWVQYYTDSIASSTRPDLIFNSDTTSSYANRYNYNGTESVAPSENSHFAGVSANTNPFFANFFIINNSASEKLSIGQGMSRGGSGAGTAPVQRFELAQKWTNTSSQITNITLTNDASANFGAKTYLKVWGSD